MQEKSIRRRLPRIVRERLDQIHQVCSSSGVPLPEQRIDGENDLLLLWRPSGVNVEMLISADGSVRWSDPARPDGVVFDVFSPDPFVSRVAEWYVGGPIIGGRRMTLEDINEAREGLS